MSNDKVKSNRQPLLSVSTLAITSSALIWAANGANRIEIAEFLRDILFGYRDFFRSLWSVIFEQFNLPFDIADHQKDMLSVISFLMGGVIFRLLTGRKPLPLFYPSIGHYLESIETKWGYGSRLLAALLFSLLAIALTVAVLAPFTNTIAFTHDFYALFMSFYAVGMAYFLGRSLVNFTRAVSKALHEKVFWAWLGKGLATLFWPVIFSIAMTITFTSITYFTDFSVINFGRQIVPLDPEPFSYRGYFYSLDTAKLIDMALLTFTALALYVSAGRSLRPLVQFLFIGGGILFLGWLSQKFMDLHPEYFTPAM